MNFKTKLALFTIPIVLISLISGFVVFSLMIDELKSSVISRLDDNSKSSLTIISRLMFERLGDINIILDETKDHNYSISSQMLLLESAVKRYKMYDSMAIYNLDGIKISDTRNLGIGIDNFEKEFFQTALKGELYVSEIPEFRESEDASTVGSQLPILYLSTPLFKEDNTFEHILVASISLDRFSHLIEKSFFVEGVSLKLLSSEGLVLYSNDDKDSVLRDVIYTDLIFTNPAENFSITTENEQEKLFIINQEEASFDYSGNDWSLLVSLPTEKVFSDALILQKNLLIFELIFTSIMMVLISLAISSLSDPFGKMKRLIRNFEKNEVENIVFRDDEFKELSQSLIKMNKTIKRDSSQLKQLSKALDEASIVAMTDLNGKITYANQKFCDISKYSREELIGQNHRILKSGHHPPEFYKDMWDEITNGKIWRGVVKNKAKDGSFYWVQTVILPNYDENQNPVGYTAVRVNITEQKRQQEMLEEQDELLQTKNIKLETKLLEKQRELIRSERFSAIGELASRVAHDIRNPLSVIRVSLENIGLAKNNPKIMERSLEKCNHSVERIAHQIDVVMDFLRDSKMNLEDIPVSTMISSMIKDMNIPENVKINIPENSIILNADKTKLYSLFSNLIINAIQAMKGEGTINISITKNADDMIIIIIDNDGPNIEESVVDQIFEPLFTTKQTGTGLGLASCKKIMEQHGGTISVTNNPVAFTMKFPKL